MSIRQTSWLHLHAHRRLAAHSQNNEARLASQIPAWIAPTATYLICTNPRSGSWLLSDGLASTGVAGNPREWFNVMEEQNYRARWRMTHSTNLNYPGYLRLARAASTTPNGISGAKLHYYQLADFRRRLEAGGVRGLSDGRLMARVFPQARYLWLRRRDKARQAISLVIAASTDEWWSIEGAQPRNSNAAGAEPVFDPQVIARTEASLLRGEAKWLSHFQTNGITPFEIVYEDLVSDYVGTIRSALHWLGVPDAETFEVQPPRLKRQSMERNEVWLELYLAWKAASGDVPKDMAPSGVTPSEAPEPLFESANPPFSRVPTVWKRWIAQARLDRLRDDEIVEVLVRNRYSRAAAIAELKSNGTA